MTIGGALVRFATAAAVPLCISAVGSPAGVVAVIDCRRNGCIVGKVGNSQEPAGSVVASPTDLTVALPLDLCAEPLFDRLAAQRLAPCSGRSDPIRPEAARDDRFDARRRTLRASTSLSFLEFLGFRGSLRSLNSLMLPILIGARSGMPTDIPINRYSLARIFVACGAP